jgi:hypothetical protein
MTPLWLLAIPQADPLAQPTPTWLAWTLLFLTFFLHLVAMNVVLGGSIIAAVARTRGRAGHAASAQLSTWLAKLMPVFVAAAVSLGVAALLFLQVLYGRLFFASSIVMAAWWLGVVPLLVAAYYGTYLLSYRGERGRVFPTVVAGVVAALFVAIAAIYVNNMSLMLRPDHVVALYQSDGRGLQLDLGDPALLPRFLHIVLGAVAVAGLVVALIGVAYRRLSPDTAAWVVRHGSTWCAGATLLNLLPGFWWLFVLPRTVLIGLMGSMPAMALFAGVTSGLVTLAAVFTAGRTARPALPLWLAVGGMVVTLGAMLLTRDQLRRASLADAGFVPTPWITPQWPAIVAFLVLFVAALVVVGWMAWLLAAGRGRLACADARSGSHDRRDDPRQAV